MTYLLDVNLLLALFDPVHEHHEQAHQWFKGRKRWSSCLLTELGFLRVASNPAYPGRLGGIDVLSQMFREFCLETTHEYWEEAPSIHQSSNQFVFQAMNYRDLTDLYLLLLVKFRKGKLATFDKKIKAKLIKQGNDLVEWIG